MNMLLLCVHNHHFSVNTLLVFMFFFLLFVLQIGLIIFLFWFLISPSQTKNLLDSVLSYFITKFVVQINLL